MERAKEIIRRRIAAAPDRITEVRWKVIEKLLEDGLSFERAGQVVDEVGETFVYFVGNGFCDAAKAGRGLLSYINVFRARDGRDIGRYIRVKLDHSAEFVKKLSELYPDDIIKAIVG